MNPRKPTREEKKELVTYMLLEEEDKENIEGLVENASIAVFDDYITDSPGYAGKVMVVVWSGDPSFTETYVWDRVYEDGKVNIPIRDERNAEEGKYTTRIRQVSLNTHEPIFTSEELEAIAESFHDAVKDDLDNALYKSLEEKAEMLLAKRYV